MNRPKGKRINSHKRVPENKLFLFFFSTDAFLRISDQYLIIWYLLKSKPSDRDTISQMRIFFVRDLPSLM